MSWTVVKKIPVMLASEDFWRAVDVWDRVPHVVNRRLACAEVLFREKMEINLESFKTAFLKIRKAHPLSKCDWEDVVLLLSNVGFSFSHYLDEDRINSNVEIILKKLLPKNSNHHAPTLEMEVLDYSADAATYATLFSLQKGSSLSPASPYKMALIRGEDSSFLELSVFGKYTPQEAPFLSTSDKSVEWLKTTLLPKFLKWASTPADTSCGSLKLISVANYGALYQSLKNKYAGKLIDLWPESTDPLKFIHEDLGIAAYLLLLWEQERCEIGLEERQSFVDIGCGNGLLVYILTEEGHPGLGIDVRSRRIWDIYPSSIKLKVSTINPSENTPFPAVDWLIGNHSDELTPWIPVMAAMIPGSRYFVLPCCPYDFFGRYGRKNPGKSVYQEYLEYIQSEVSENLCKFVTSTDRLRIPSTKRVCIIGKKKSEEGVCKDYEDITPHEFLTLYLGYRCSYPVKTSPADCHSPGNRHDLFIPRPAKERVRNCTKVNPQVISEVVSIVAAEVLSGPGEDHTFEEDWDCGRTLPLETLAKLIPSHLLENLKKECGGLQTLLKNNHFIFKVIGGMVSFRKPTVKGEWKKDHSGNVKNQDSKQVKSHWKSKPCWFNTYHPSGCPLMDTQCSYAHIK